MSSVISHNGVGRFAAEHPAAVKFGRLGWLAKGIVYAVAGALAMMIAAESWDSSPASTSAPTSGDTEGSPTGALKTISGLSGGKLLMWLLAVGMLTYAAWRLLSAFLPSNAGAKAWIVRIGYVASTVVYTTFAFTAIDLARSRGAEPDGNTEVVEISGRIMAHTGGRVLIGLVGVAIIGAGLYRIAKGAKLDVNDELDLSGMSPTRLTWTKRLGAVGEIGRGIGIGLVGFFLTRATITYDRNEATGLDGALRRLATQSWGVVIVVVVAVGFIAYGIFCLATFTRRRLEAPS